MSFSNNSHFPFCFLKEEFWGIGILGMEWILEAVLDNQAQFAIGESETQVHGLT